MCPDFVSQKESEDTRYDDNATCNECIKTNKVIKRLQKDIEYYQNRIVD